MQGAPPRFAVKQGALGDLNCEHLLLRKRLSAELHLVGAVRFGSATLLVRRTRAPALRCVFGPMQLDDIRDIVHAEPIRAERHAGDRPHAASDFGIQGMQAPVRDDALGGQRVLGPKWFGVDEGALARTLGVVLEG
jgi:hypothetical protein